MSGSDDDRHFPRPVPIDAYGNGGFRFADMSHRGSLLCLPDGIWAWAVTRPDDITTDTLERVIARAGTIDTLLVGTGRESWRPPPKLHAKLRELGLSADFMQTGPALRIYNIMVAEGRRVAAALIAVD